MEDPSDNSRRNRHEILRNLVEIGGHLGEIMAYQNKIFHIPTISGYICWVIRQYQVFFGRKILAVTTISDDRIRQEAVGSFPT